MNIINQTCISVLFNAKLAFTKIYLCVVISSCFHTSFAFGDDLDEKTQYSNIWQNHILEELLLFWKQSDLAFEPFKGFPGHLCNDGSRPVSNKKCSGVNLRWANNPTQTIVSHSRQIFAYAIAFHITGNDEYLDIALSGIDYQFDVFFEQGTGLFYESYDLKTKQKITTYDNQKQAYSLLGLCFVYYLTGDLNLYNKIVKVIGNIKQKLRDNSDGSYSEFGNQVPSDILAKHLDHINAYYALLAAQAPVHDRKVFLNDAIQTVHYIKSHFFNLHSGAVDTQLTMSSNGGNEVHYGYSLKTYWFIDQIAFLANDLELSNKVQKLAKALLNASFDDEVGAWISKVNEDGKRDSIALWWPFAEVNQYAASLSISDKNIAEKVNRANQFWLEVFVDHEYGGIYSKVDLARITPLKHSWKHHEWKAGFHSFEHALINYIASAGRSGKSLELYFTRDDLSSLTLLYGFHGQIELIDSYIGNNGHAIRKYSVSNIRYGLE